MSKTLRETHFSFPNQVSFYQGKVRDVYTVGDEMIIISTDRISAFDHVLPRAIPCKGQVLNQLSYYFLQKVRDIVPIWAKKCPHPNVTIGLACQPIPIEVVVRGYLAGHAWRTYANGERLLCGVELPMGLRESDAFEKAIITPATKAKSGHDEDISRDELIEKGIISEEMYTQIEEYAQKLFMFGSDYARSHGLILVDTKYEFGIYKDVVHLIDEIHTPDSSRYYVLDGYKERQNKGEPQLQLSKEFVREWLMNQGFMGKEGDVMPDIPDEFVDEVAEKYISLYEKLTDLSFEVNNDARIEDAIYSSIYGYLYESMEL